MEAPSPEVIDVHPVAHPSPPVARAGFPLDHQYLESCWMPVVGPSSVALLRQCVARWKEEVPARVDIAELAGTLGLGRGTGRNSPIIRTLDRLERFGFANQVSATELHVYTEVPPVPGRQLERLPSWTRDRHERLLGRHLAGLAHSPEGPATPRAGEPSRTPMAERLARFTSEATQSPRRHL